MLLKKIIVGFLAFSTFAIAEAKPLSVNVRILSDVNSVPAVNEEPNAYGQKLVDILNTAYQDGMSFVLGDSQVVVSALSAKYFNVSDVTVFTTKGFGELDAALGSSKKDTLTIYIVNRFEGATAGIANLPTLQILTGKMRGYSAAFEANTLSLNNGQVVSHEVGHLMGFRHVASSSAEVVLQKSMNVPPLLFITPAQQLLDFRLSLAKQSVPALVTWRGDILSGGLKCRTVRYPIFAVTYSPLNLSTLQRSPAELEAASSKAATRILEKSSLEKSWDPRSNIMSYAISLTGSNPSFYSGKYEAPFKEILDCQDKIRSK